MIHETGRYAGSGAIFRLFSTDWGTCVQRKSVHVCLFDVLAERQCVG
jgi:hypothetical protein